MADEDKFYEEEDIGGSPPDEKNWKGIIIAVLVICFVLGMIITSVFLLTPPDEGPRIRGKRLTLDQILGPTLKVREFNGTWVSDNELAYLDTSGGLSIFNAENFTSTVLISNLTFKQLNIEDFTISPDHKFVLLSEKGKKNEQVFSSSKYYIYDVSSMHAKPLTHKPEDRGHPPLINAQFSPVGSSLSIVDLNFNIYYKRKADATEVYPLTNTGDPGAIYNGAPDWMYENEILGDKIANWFSPDGNKIAYATFNDSVVDEVPILHYSKDKQYPTLTNMRYPKAGQTNPRISLWVLDLDDPRNPKPRDVKPPNGVKDQLVTSTLWFVWEI